MPTVKLLSKTVSLEKYELSTGEIMLRYVKYKRTDGSCPYSVHHSMADAEVHLADLLSRAKSRQIGEAYVNAQIQLEM